MSPGPQIQSSYLFWTATIYKLPISSTSLAVPTSTNFSCTTSGQVVINRSKAYVARLVDADHSQQETLPNTTWRNWASMDSLIYPSLLDPLPHNKQMKSGGCREVGSAVITDNSPPWKHNNLTITWTVTSLWRYLTQPCFFHITQTDNTKTCLRWAVNQKLKLKHKKLLLTTVQEFHPAEYLWKSESTKNSGQNDLYWSSMKYL